MKSIVIFLLLLPLLSFSQNTADADNTPDPRFEGFMKWTLRYGLDSQVALQQDDPYLKTAIRFSSSHYLKYQNSRSMGYGLLMVGGAGTVVTFVADRTEVNGLENRNTFYLLSSALLLAGCYKHIAASKHKYRAEERLLDALYHMHN